MKPKTFRTTSSIKICLIAIAASLFQYACEYEPLPTYSGVDNVYFFYAAVGLSGTPVDSSSIMFGYDLIPKTDSVIYIMVRILGSVKDYPRTVSFTLDEERSTAQLGRDVELLSLNDDDVLSSAGANASGVVPAGGVIGLIAIRLFNNESLADGASLVAALKLVENEHFKVDYTYSERFRGVSQARNYNATRYRVWFNNNNERPNMWTPATYESEFTRAFGVFSREKFRLMCEILPGCSWDYFSYGPGQRPEDVFSDNFPVALLMGWSRTLRFYLEYYEELNGEPMLDENGLIITSGVWAD